MLENLKLITPVSPQSPAWQIGHERPILLLGSCFSDEVGQRLIRAGFDVLCNPFGTLYNPLSIASCLSRTVEKEQIVDEYLVYHEGLWHSWLHHGRFSHPDKQTALDMANQSIAQTHEFLQRQPVLILTFGTAWAFRLVNDRAGEAVRGQVVANCHKLPASYFERFRLGIDEIVGLWKPMLQGLGLDTILTVSPIRHLADGAHGNQLSKSTLLLATENLVSDHVDYFPSYEIVMDQLRDYRFYARDLCHPSDVAVDIIWEAFQETYMTASTRQRCRYEEKRWRQTQHRPMHSN